MNSFQLLNSVWLLNSVMLLNFVWLLNFVQLLNFLWLLNCSAVQLFLILAYPLVSTYRVFHNNCGITTNPNSERNKTQTVQKLKFYNINSNHFKMAVLVVWVPGFLFLVEWGVELAVNWASYIFQHLMVVCFMFFVQSFMS